MTENNYGVNASFDAWYGSGPTTHVSHEGLARRAYQAGFERARELLGRDDGKGVEFVVVSVLGVETKAGKALRERTTQSK